MGKHNTPKGSRNGQLNTRIQAAKKGGYLVMEKFTKIAGRKVITGYYAVKDEKPATALLPTMGQTLSKIGY